MRKVWMAALFLCSGVVFTAVAQPCPPDDQGMGPGPRQMRRQMMHERRMERMQHRRMEKMRMMHERGTPETVRGRVVSIEPRPMGAEMMVESESRHVAVMLGPGWAPPESERKLEPNDRIVVSGVRVTRGGNSFIVPDEITLTDDGREITLRPHPPEGMEPDGRGPRARSFRDHAY